MKIEILDKPCDCAICTAIDAQLDYWLKKKLGDLKREMERIANEHPTDAGQREAGEGT